MNQRVKKDIRSPLRYPGGKSKFLEIILPNIPADYYEFREPFVGGGSIFLAALQKINHKASYRINDLNRDVFCFWKELKTNSQILIREICRFKAEYPVGKELFKLLTEKDLEKSTDIERAVRFFIINRITFSGTTDSGGFSEQAFLKRFTTSSIERLSGLPRLLSNVSVEYGDYEKLVLEKGEKVFVFLDPPYFTATKSKLYGKNGDLHLKFDHTRFAQVMKKCPHKWLITYDDCKEVRELFSFPNVSFYAWKAQYGMTNVASKVAGKGNELLIANYRLPLVKQGELTQFSS